MSILIDADTKVLVQGITGEAAQHHTKNMLDYGTKIVAGVRPGAGGQRVHGVLVYDSVEKATAEHQLDASILFVPAKAMKQAALEALTAGIKLIVMVSEHVPVHDTMAIIEKAEQVGADVIGPNTPGLISPGAKCKLGFVPQQYFTPGQVGVASRSGTLTYEIVSRLTLAGIGQSTCVGVGGDGIVGLPFPKICRYFQNDPETKAILLVGEIGGSAEEETAELIAAGEITKPVVAYLTGRTAPPDKRMGHAGAIVAGGRGSIDSKLKAFAQVGVPVAAFPGEVAALLKKIL